MRSSIACFFALVLIGCAGEAPAPDAGPLRDRDEPCTEDRQCLSGFCYGEVDPLGTFAPPVCHLRCIALTEVDHYCRSDSHCCEGRCCIGCADREGTCVTD